MLRSASWVLVMTRVPPSLQIRAAALSRGRPLARIRVMTEHMLHDGRQGCQRQELQRVGGANENDGEGQSLKRGMGIRTLVE